MISFIVIINLIGIILAIAAGEPTSGNVSNIGCNNSVENHGAASKSFAIMRESSLNLFEKVNHYNFSILSHKAGSDMTNHSYHEIWKSMHDSSRDILANKIRQLYPLVEQLLLDANTSVECNRGLLTTIHSAGRLERWAVQCKYRILVISFSRSKQIHKY